MKIERTQNEIILRFPSSDFDALDIQKILDFIQYKQIINKSQGTEDIANQLAAESKVEWWRGNKKRFIK